MNSPTIEGVAHSLYTAYCKAVGGKAFNGDKLPLWSEFTADPSKKTQADAWRAVAGKAITLSQTK